MPLVKLMNICSAEVALWQVTETEEALAALVLPEDAASVGGFASAGRRVERLAWRAALRSAGVWQSVAYSQTGAPVLKDSDKHISVSHCKGMACVAISSVRCGVDIESADRDCSRVSRRFMSEREGLILAGSSNPYAAAWCMKEALYKYAGREGIDFLRDIRITENKGGIYDAVVAGEPAVVRLMHEEGCMIAFVHAPAPAQP